MASMARICTSLMIFVLVAGDYNLTQICADHNNTGCTTSEFYGSFLGSMMTSCTSLYENTEFQTWLDGIGPNFLKQTNYQLLNDMMYHRMRVIRAQNKIQADGGKDPELGTTCNNLELREMKGEDLPGAGSEVTVKADDGRVKSDDGTVNPRVKTEPPSQPPSQDPIPSEPPSQPPSQDPIPSEPPSQPPSQDTTPSPSEDMAHPSPDTCDDMNPQSCAEGSARSEEFCHVRSEECCHSCSSQDHMKECPMHAASLNGACDEKLSLKCPKSCAAGAVCDLKDCAEFEVELLINNKQKKDECFKLASHSTGDKNEDPSLEQCADAVADALSASKTDVQSDAEKIFGNFRCKLLALGAQIGFVCSYRDTVGSDTVCKGLDYNTNTQTCRQKTADGIGKPKYIMAMQSKGNQLERRVTKQISCTAPETSNSSSTGSTETSDASPAIELREGHESSSAAVNRITNRQHESQMLNECKDENTTECQAGLSRDPGFCKLDDKQVQPVCCQTCSAAVTPTQAPTTARDATDLANNTLAWHMECTVQKVTACAKANCPECGQNCEIDIMHF